MNFGAFVRPLLTIGQNFTQKKLEHKEEIKKLRQEAGNREVKNPSLGPAVYLFREKMKKFFVFSVKTSRERK